MEFNTFETEFFLCLKTNNLKRVIKKINAQSKLVEEYLSEDRNSNIVDKFVQKFNKYLLLQNDHKKIGLYEKILNNSAMKKVLEKFQKSDILIQALKENNSKHLIKWLLTMNIDLYVQDKDGMTALMYSVQSNKLLFVVKHILFYGYESIHILNKNGENALFYSLNQLDCLNELLRTEIDINQKNNNMETALLYCCKNDIYEPIEYLINRKDIDVNVTDFEDKTAAMYLTEKGRYFELRHLNNRNCYFNFVNEKNESVMSILINKLYEPVEQRQYGLFNNYINILVSLVRFNCSFDLPVDEDKNTALMALILVNDHNTLSYVLNHSNNYDLSIKNKYGENASSLFMKCKNLNSYTELMINHPSFDFNYVDPKTGNTMLMLAAMTKPLLVEKFIEKNVYSINQVNLFNENAIILATKCNNKECAFDLIDNAIYVDQQDHLGNTALHYAVMGNNKFFISSLLSINANIHVKNNEGKTPLDLAHDMNNKIIISLLTNNEILGILAANDEKYKAKEENVNIDDEIIKSYLNPRVTNKFDGFTMEKQFIHIEKRIYSNLIENINIKNKPILGNNRKISICVR